MKTVDEILSSGVIYSDKLKIGDDGFKGFLVIDRLDMSFVASWGGGWEHVSVAPLKRIVVKKETEPTSVLIVVQK